MSIHELAVKTDTELAKQFAEMHKAECRIDIAIDRVHESAGDRHLHTRNWQWGLTHAEALDLSSADRVTELAAAEAEAVRINLGIQALNEVWAANGRWSRFYLVTNTNGHIHSSMNCSTCFNSTQFAFLPNLSGLDEAAAVTDQGEILCSICFPSAPVAWTTGESKATKEARAERAAVKAAKDAKKLETALLPDGTDLRLPDQKRIKTLRSAKMWLTDAASWNRGRAPADFHPSYTADVVALVADAVAAKTGDPVAQVLADAAKRSAKRDGV